MRHYAAKVAALSRSRTASDPELVEARRALHAAQIERHVKESLADLRELTPAERDRINVLLRVSE